MGNQYQFVWINRKRGKAYSEALSSRIVFFGLVACIASVSFRGVGEQRKTKEPNRNGILLARNWGRVNPTEKLARQAIGRAMLITETGHDEVYERG